MYTEVKAKTILSKLRGGADPYFGISYNMNVYRGCEHACIYCDSRSECYQLGELSDIRYKINAPELLNKELKSKRKKGTIGTGSMNDPYMPAEIKFKLVSKCLKIISNYNYPIHIITKSNNVLNDKDIISEISKTYAAVSFTITCSSDLQSLQIEPKAPTSSERFKAIYELAKNNIYTGICLMPILPFYNDKIENIENIFRKAADLGAGYIIPFMGLTQRKGQKEYFHACLDKIDDSLRNRYEKTFGNNYSCNSPSSKLLYERISELSELYKIPLKMNFFEIKNQDSQLSLF